jgi:phage gp46-like protein
MELVLQNGDYVSDGAAGVRSVQGQEALLQRVLFRLTAKRGTFPFWETLGSRLWQLGQLPVSARQAAAKQYVAEALEEERELTVEDVVLTQVSERTSLTAELACGDGRLSVTMDLRT